MQSRTRSKAVTLRMTENELAYFQAQMKRANQKNQTDFFLSVLKKKPIIVIEELVPVLVELKRQGNNLNQIVKKMNEGIPVGESAKEMLSECHSAYKNLIDFEVK